MRRSARRTPSATGSGALTVLSRHLPAWLAPAGARRVAVVGADGFVGSHLVAAALAAGARVAAACVKKPWRLDGLRDARLLDVVRLPGGDWWSPAAAAHLDEVLSESDAVALLAYTPPPDDGADRALEHELEVNAAGAARVAALAARHGLPLVFASSADVYGPWRDGRVGEDDEPAPARPYARAKLAAEKAIGEALPGRAVSLRLATVFGPGERGPRAIPSFVRALAGGERPVVHSDGSDVRDYVHVGDVAAAFVNACVLAGGDPGAAPPVLNVGSGTGRSTLEILTAVEAVLGTARPPLHRPSRRPPSRLVLDARRASESLGFSPRPDFEEALAEEVRWLVADTRATGSPAAQQGESGERAGSP